VGETPLFLGQPNNYSGVFVEALGKKGASNFSQKTNPSSFQVEQNLESGFWTLSSNVKRYGFVEILERGEKIGIVKCISCPTTCSRNSFKKIR
jgi:hypothetical protein